MWSLKVITVLLVGVALGHPHHQHDTKRSQDVQGHDRTRRPPLVCPPKSLACCKVPELIDEADLKEAGFEGPLIPPPPPHRHHGPPPPHGRPPPNHDGPPSSYGPAHHDRNHFDHQGRGCEHDHFLCEKEKCIFNKLDWLIDKTTLNTEAFTTYFSEWASAHEGWSPAANLVVQNCLNQEEDEHAPPGMCIEMKTIFCLEETLLQNCPSDAWTSSERCENLKKAFECHDRKYRPPLHLLAECCAVSDVVEKTKLTECGKDSLLPPPPPHHHHHGPPHEHGPPHHHGPPHDGFPHNHGPPPPNHHGPPTPNDHFGVHGPGCERHWALFEKLGWLNRNRTLNSEAYGEHIHTWLNQHQAWSDVKDKVLDICAQVEPDIHMCLPHRILICSQRVLADNCPDSSWKSSKMCAGGPPTSNPTSPDQPGSETSVTDPINEDQPNQGESIPETSIEEIGEDLDSQVENMDVGVDEV